MKRLWSLLLSVLIALPQAGWTEETYKDSFTADSLKEDQRAAAEQELRTLSSAEVLIRFAKAFPIKEVMKGLRKALARDLTNINFESIKPFIEGTAAALILYKQGFHEASAIHLAEAWASLALQLETLYGAEPKYGNMNQMLRKLFSIMFTSFVGDSKIIKLTEVQKIESGLAGMLSLLPTEAYWERLSTHLQIHSPTTMNRFKKGLGQLLSFQGAIGGSVHFISDPGRLPSPLSSAFHILTYQLAFRTGYLQFDQNSTAAGLNRTDFELVNREFKVLPTPLILGIYGSAFHLDQTLASIRAHIQSSPWAALPLEEMEIPVKAFVAFLVLARQGFADAALMQLSRGLVETASRFNRMSRAHSLTPDQLTQLLQFLFEASVKNCMNGFGFLKQHEMDRLYLSLNAAAEKMRSEDFRQQVLKSLSSEYVAAHNYENRAHAAAVLGAITGLISLIIGTNYLVGFGEFMSNPPSVAVTSILAAMFGGGLATGLFTLRVGHHFGRRRARIPDLRVLADRCQALLTPSGEVVP